MWFCLNQGDIVWFLCHLHKPMSTEYLQKEFWVSFKASWKFWHMLSWLCYYSSLSGWGTNLAGVQHIFRLPFKWCEVADLKIPAWQQLVIPLFWGLYVQFLPFSFAFLFTGCHQLFRSYFQHFERSHSIFLKLKQNLLQTDYSSKSTIFQVCQNHKWNNTHLYLFNGCMCYSLIPSRSDSTD